MTLDRILQSQGFGTRRYCGDLIAAGLVEVNGELCDDPRASFEVDGLRLTVDGEEWLACTKAYLMLNKPTGYECSQRPRHRVTMRRATSLAATAPSRDLRRTPREEQGARISSSEIPSAEGGNGRGFRMRC